MSKKLFTKRESYPWLKAIAAVGEGNLVIGKERGLPWNCPDEFQFFLNSTKGTDWFFYGRRCFIGSRQRPDLKFQKEAHSIIYVISSYLEQREDARVIRDLTEIEEPPEGTTMWVCGGSTIYELMLPYCSELYISTVHGEHEGVKFFPEFRNDFHVDKTVIETKEYSSQIWKRNE